MANKRSEHQVDVFVGGAEFRTIGITAAKGRDADEFLTNFKERYLKDKGSRITYKLNGMLILSLRTTGTRWEEVFNSETA